MLQSDDREIEARHEKKMYLPYGGETKLVRERG